MASPSNASEPESPEEEEYVDAGFDGYLFWDRYRNIILIVVGVLALTAAGYFIFQYQQGQTFQAAGAALAQASTEDDFHSVMDRYPGTVAAGNAALLLAGRLRTDGKFDESMTVLQDFIAKYPSHPLVHGAELSIAETLEAQGKMDEALAKYQEVAAKYPDTYSAPVAVLDQANLLESQGKTDDARRVYENFVAQFPDSVFAQQAMAEMRLMRTGTGGTASAEASPAPTILNPETLSVPNLMSTPPSAGGTAK